MFKLIIYYSDKVEKIEIKERIINKKILFNNYLNEIYDYEDGDLEHNGSILQKSNVLSFDSLDIVEYILDLEDEYEEE